MRAKASRAYLGPKLVGPFLTPFSPSQAVGGTAVIVRLASAEIGEFSLRLDLLGLRTSAPCSQAACVVR